MLGISIRPWTEEVKPVRSDRVAGRTRPRLPPGAKGGPPIRARRSRVRDSVPQRRPAPRHPPRVIIITPHREGTRGRKRSDTSPTTTTTTTTTTTITIKTGIATRTTVGKRPGEPIAQEGGRRATRRNRHPVEGVHRQKKAARDPRAGSRR